MPHSPFTRYIAFSIIAAYAGILLWPDPRAQIVGLSALMALPLVLALFTWSAVRDAPAFNDHAFHRTLPTDDAEVFRRTLRIHGMVLLGIALVVVTYCLLVDFSWQVMAYGVATLAVPVWAFMALCGIAMSAATSNEHGKSWAYISTFAVPVLSALLLHNVRMRFFPEDHGRFYFNQLRAVVVAGAVLYPLCWWLVAARRRRTAGLVLGMAVGALTPWVTVYGGFFRSPTYEVERAQEGPAIKLTRKAVVPGDGKWIRVDDLLNVEGLREGEYLEINGISSVDARSIQAFEVPDDPALAEKDGVFHGRWVVGRPGGENIQWGRNAVWDILRKQVPAHETFGFWNPLRNTPTHVALLKPGESAKLYSRAVRGDSKPRFATQPPGGEGPDKMALRSIDADVCKMVKLGVVSVESGGTCPLPGGGEIRVGKIQKNAEDYSLSIDCYSEELSPAQAPWIEKHGEGTVRLEPKLIAVDESGKHAFAVESADLRYERGTEVLGGRNEKYVLRVKTDLPAYVARMEMLRKCQLHVFVPIVKQNFRQALIPVN